MQQFRIIYADLLGRFSVVFTKLKVRVRVRFDQEHLAIFGPELWCEESVGSAQQRRQRDDTDDRQEAQQTRRRGCVWRRATATET